MIPIVEHTYTNADGEKRRVTKVFSKTGNVIYNNEQGQSVGIPATEWDKWCQDCTDVYTPTPAPPSHFAKAAAIRFGQQIAGGEIKSEFNKEAKWEKPQQIKKTFKKS